MKKEGMGEERYIYTKEDMSATRVLAAVMMIIALLEVALGFR